MHLLGARDEAGEVGDEFDSSRARERASAQQRDSGVRRCRAELRSEGAGIDRRSRISGVICRVAPQPGFAAREGRGAASAVGHVDLPGPEVADHGRTVHVIGVGRRQVGLGDRDRVGHACVVGFVGLGDDRALVDRAAREMDGRLVLGSQELKELRSRIHTAVYTTGSSEVTLRGDGLTQAIQLVDAILESRQAA